jgi:gliding motility-associated-like protein
MKRITWFILIMLMVISTSHAQQFRKIFQLNIDESLTDIQAEWVALDRDTLLDLVVTGIAANGQMKIVTYQNNKGESLIKKFTQLTGFKSGTIQLSDWNADNLVDVLVAGKTLLNTDALFVFENKGDFTFAKSPSKLLDHASLFRIADLNQDGKLDVITSGIQNTISFLRIYQHTNKGLTLAFDTLGITSTDIEVFDLNKNGKNDFIISGSNAAQLPAILLFTNKGNFKFVTQQLPGAVEGRISAIDDNEDGLFDLMVVGKDESNQYINRIWLNKTDSFTIRKTYSSLQNAEIFTGDMNSDGLADQLINGYDAQGKKVNIIQEQNGIITRLDTLGLLTQRMGDFDRDGDLDLLQVIDSLNQQWLKIYEYQNTIENQNPGIPTNAFAISAFNKTFIYWQAPQDDHANSASITYDLWLGTAQSTLIPATFDLTSKRRMTVSHGNAGTNTSQIIEGLTDNRYFYQIQSVDNAYNGGYNICIGGVLPCFDLATKDVQVCKEEEVTLVSASEAYWFSLTRGFLGVFDSLQFTAIENDTIFSFVPQGVDCSKNTVWLIYVNEGPAAERELMYACENEPIKLGIAPGWEAVTWNSVPPVTSKDTISFILKKDEVITVSAQSKSGCDYQKEFTIRVSKPQLKLNGEVFQILKGNSVQLEATSTATQFKWSPAAGLSNDAIFNPVASPLQTIDYIVVATDSVGCTIDARVQVQVEETAFVPNLFTPNGDGKNDQLLVYGLTTASSFSFMIYNREGNLMYETNDILQATSSGWNGTVRGTLQPSGVYYWKVDGKTTNGAKLLLNGKKSGTILLVH